MFDYFPKHMTYLILSACTHFQKSLGLLPLTCSTKSMTHLHLIRVGICQTLALNQYL